MNEDGTVMDETEMLHEICFDSEGFAVSSNPHFLYKIAEMCANSGRYLEEGLLCLDDYLNILVFHNPTES